MLDTGRSADRAPLAAISPLIEERDQLEDSVSAVPYADHDTSISRTEEDDLVNLDPTAGLCMEICLSNNTHKASHKLPDLSNSHILV